MSFKITKDNQGETKEQNRIGLEGVPHFKGLLNRERREPLDLGASICDLTDHAVLESPECYIYLSYFQSKLATLQISDNYGPGFEGIDQNGEKNPLSMVHTSVNHDKDDKESTYGYGTKRALMKLVWEAIIYTRTMYNGKMQYIKIDINFLDMIKKSAIESYNTKKTIIQKEEYNSIHPYDYGSSVVLSNFVRNELENIHAEHFKYIIREHYSNRLNKINLLVNGSKETLLPPILSKVNFDKNNETDGMFKLNIDINVYVNNFNKTMFKIYAVIEIGEILQTCIYDSTNPKKRGWGGSYLKGRKPDDFIQIISYSKKTLNMSAYYYGKCNNIIELRPTKPTPEQRAPGWEGYQHFNRETAISHNGRHYNFIRAVKFGNNDGMHTVGFVDYSDKIFTELLGLDSQKAISGTYEQLSPLCKKLGAIQNLARQALEKHVEKVAAVEAAAAVLAAEAAAAIAAEAAAAIAAEAAAVLAEEAAAEEAAAAVLVAEAAEAAASVPDPPPPLHAEAAEEAAAAVLVAEAAEAAASVPDPPPPLHAEAAAEAVVEAAVEFDAGESDAGESDAVSGDDVDVPFTESSSVELPQSVTIDVSTGNIKPSTDVVSGETKTSEPGNNLPQSVLSEVTNELTTLILNETTVPSYNKRMLARLNEPTFYNMLENIVKSDGFTKLKQNADIEKIVGKEHVEMLQHILEGIQLLKSQEIETNH